MTRLAHLGAPVIALAAFGLAAGCPSPEPNRSLWLAPNGSEVIIQMVDYEPPPW
jgi:hypothetical protein